MIFIEDPWEVLGIERTSDAREIRRAYAARLKVTHPEDDAEGFQRLRMAYEFALAWGTRLVDPATAASAEVAIEDDAVPDEQARPADDPLVLAQQQTLAELARHLSATTPLDVERAQALLASAVDDERMDRLDLLQKTETQLAEMLAGSIPRSDPLLAVAEKKFEWTARREERSLPYSAREVIARLVDVEWLDRLTTYVDEEARAYARLMAPARPRERLVHAYLLHSGSWPEIELIHKLENEHPRLLDAMPEENVEWWRRFESLPKFSLSTVLVGLVVGLFAVVALGDEHGDYTPYLWLMPACGLAFGLFRYYAIDWPIMWTMQRWYGAPPRWFTIGWFGASIALMFAALPARATPWLGWFIALLAGATALWAQIAAGPRPSIFANDDTVLWNSRLIRAVVLNLVAVAWLGFTTRDIPDAFSTPLNLTILAALTASGLGRDVQVQTFQSALDSRWQTGACVLAILLAIVLGVLVIGFAGRPAWQAPLFVAVLSCVLLRRCVRTSFEMPTFGAGFRTVLVIGLLSLMRAYSAGFQPEASSAIIDWILIGSLLMLTGVVIAAVRYTTLNRS